jgi:hypothetical protein
MPADLYCDIDGAQHGPLTVAQLKHLADKGVLQPSHGVWRSGMNKKVPASTIRGLFDDAPVAVSVVEEEDPAKDRPAKKATHGKEREEEPEPELLAEVPITYREGLPDVDGPLLATLYVESTRLRFVFDDEDMEDFPISFERIENVLEPARGDFPQAMKKKALAAKVSGKVGKLAAGMVGQMIGGSTGDLVEKVGGGASGMAEKGGDLGRPPRNRITFIALFRKERHKVRFDTYGDSREDMSAEAKALYRQIRDARDRFSAGQSDDDEYLDYEEVPEDEEERIPLSEPEEKNGRSAAGPAIPAPLPSASPDAGKPFRVMRAGSIHGPYSLEQLRVLFAGGKVTAEDLIGVETWLPFSTLSGMIASGGASRSVPGTSSTTRPGEAPPHASHAAPPASDGEAIPVDDEFKL